MAAGGRHHRVASVCFEDGLLLVLFGQGGDGVPEGPVANSASGSRVHTQMGVGKIKAEKIINVPRDAESLGMLLSGWVTKLGRGYSGPQALGKKDLG